MQRRSMFHRDRGSSLLQLTLVIIITIIAAAILFVPLASTREDSRKSSCQNNMKELATAFHMYLHDYDNAIPSSALHRPKGAKTWDARTSAEFCSELGVRPPSENMKPRDVHWVQLLYPHMKNKDIIWCHLDEDRPHVKGLIFRRQHVPGPRTMVSYLYKPAIDRAWFGSMCPMDPSKPGKKLVMKCFRRESHYGFVADQIIFFERASYHWGDERKGWSEGVNLNAAFLDGHVRSVRLKNAINKPSPKDSAELAKYLMMDGEPMYYNYAPHSTDPTKGKHIQGQCYDPRIYCDNLP